MYFLLFTLQSISLTLAGMSEIYSYKVYYNYNILVIYSYSLWWQKNLSVESIFYKSVNVCKPGKYRKK